MQRKEGRKRKRILMKLGKKRKKSANYFDKKRYEC